jgi:beta-glucosidase
VNIHRAPLAGRNFECYAEDPLLSGALAACFVRGAQGQGVVTTVKHFAGNEAEFERMSINSIIDERTLREIYLVPFETAVRDGGALGVMTAYNRINGPFSSEQRELITDVLRGEWGFTGFVLTDWLANGSTVGSARAGTDLEMPGPARFYGPAVAAAVRAGDLEESTVDDQVRRLLGVFARIGAFDETTHAPDDDRPEHTALAREAAADSFVLLKNDGVLPLPNTVRTLALIGPSTDRAPVSGGGSSSLTPRHRTSPLAALRARLGGHVEIVHERGCDIDRLAPAITTEQLMRADGSSGLDVEFFDGQALSGPVKQRRSWGETRIFSMGEPAPGVDGPTFSFRASGRFTPDETGTHTLTLVQAGRARVLIDGTVVLDGSSAPVGGGKEFFGLGSTEMRAPVELVAGEPVDLVIEYSNQDSIGVNGVRVGCRRPASDAELLDRAVTAATAADAVIVMVGTNGDWESEGHDRVSMDLPGGQDQLVRRVLAANLDTVVVVNSGAPVTMDWADDARAVLQVWFGGQELGDAFVDVVMGESEPGGRLPMTLPRRLEDNPSFGNFPGEHGEVRYGEGLLVGYRWYDTRGVSTRFPFGHGLSYTSMTIGEPSLSSDTFAAGEMVTLSVEVANVGARRGVEVVQCYVAPLEPSVFRPVKELKAFEKVWLEPGERRVVSLELDDRAFSVWDPSMRSWRLDPGGFTLHVGRSSVDLPQAVSVHVS